MPYYDPKTNLLPDKISAREFQAMQQKKGKGYQALGRMKAGQMNKTEAKYAAHLETQKHSGEIIDWKFDAINLRLADGCFYKTDFMVMRNDRSLEMHEVKGFMTDDALVKLKVASSLFPFRFVLVKWVKGQWNYTDY